jgi:hypothetical protein
MSIEDRNLKPGTVLVGRYHKKDHRCEVVKGEEGKVRYRLENGREFASPSAAGTAVMGGVACNGWRFWTVEGTGKPATARTTAKKAATKAKPVRKGKAVAKPKPAKKAKPKAKARKPATNGAAPSKGIACGTCGQEFPNTAEATEHMRTEHNPPEAAGSGGR